MAGTALAAGARAHLVHGQDGHATPPVIAPSSICIQDLNMEKVLHQLRRAVWCGICFLIGAAMACGADLADCSFVSGWQQQGATRHFTPDNLYEYMDGNAESYLAYGFVQMQGVTCKQGADTLVIDVSEMVDADAAYGIFSGNRDPNQPLAKIGMGGQILPRRGTFAKGNYYVEIAATPEDDHTRDLTDFITVIEKQIEGRTTLPEALSWFPPDKLASARMVPESVLGIRALKRGYVAQYDHGKAFLVLEATPESAAATMAKLRQRYPGAQAAQLADEALQLHERYLSGTCFFRKGRYIGGYTNLPDGPSAVAASAALAARMP